MEERLRTRAGELDAARAGAEAAGERAADAEARARDLYEENKRLSEHISVGGRAAWLPAGWRWKGMARGAGPLLHAITMCSCVAPKMAINFNFFALPYPSTPQDLESRKRAPLYQKKQEEELKAAQDKAAEAEIRACEAELKCKEARVSGVGVGSWARWSFALGSGGGSWARLSFALGSWYIALQEWQHETGRV